MSEAESNSLCCTRHEPDWNCEEMDRVWASVPSSATRHNSIGSGSSIYCLWDPEAESMQCCITETTVSTMNRQQAQTKLETLSPSELFFEIRHFLEAPDNVLFLVRYCDNDCVHPIPCAMCISSGYDECRAFITYEGNRLSLLPNRVSRREELGGVFVLDIADIVLHEASPLRLVDDGGPGSSGMPMFGFTIVATEQILTVCTPERWKRDRIAERVQRLRRLAMVQAPSLSNTRWFRGVASVSASEDTVATPQAGGSSSVGSRRWGGDEAVLYFQVTHHACPHSARRRLLVVNRRDQSLHLIAIDTCTDQRAIPSASSDALALTDAAGSGAPSSARRECGEMCARTAQFSVIQMQLSDVCEIRAGSYGCFFSDCTTSEKVSATAHALSRLVKQLRNNGTD